MKRAPLWQLQEITITQHISQLGSVTSEVCSQECETVGEQRISGHRKHRHTVRCRFAGCWSTSAIALYAHNDHIPWYVYAVWNLMPVNTVQKNTSPHATLLVLYYRCIMHLGGANCFRFHSKKNFKIAVTCFKL